MAVGVAAEEVLQEAVTWGGGMWLFNRIYTPVILQTELVSTVDGQVIWTDTSMARINRKALKALPEEARNTKEIRLRKTAETAVVRCPPPATWVGICLDFGRAFATV